jgi:purine-binding chemotaxis protein CheW
MSSHGAKPHRQEKAAVDWRGMEERMGAVCAAIERGWAPSAEEVERILKARAWLLAQELAPAEAVDVRIEVVDFLLAYEHYAIESRYVREVHPLENLTPVPCAPAFVRGVINLRGEILSVIDIKIFFDLPVRGLTDLDKVIVLQSGNMSFGILADAITGVRRIPTADIQASLPTLRDIRTAYLRGVTSDRTVILDAEKLLFDTSIIVRQQVDE